MPSIKQAPLLCTKTIKNINPETIGWIRPDGRINFSTNDSAKQYAINRCLNALNQPKKFERAVILKDNVVLTEKDGTANNVKLRKCLKQIKNFNNCDLYHGHTLPLPLSSDDHICLLTQNSLKSITAINIDCNYSTITKQPLPKIKHLPKKLNDIYYSMKYKIRAGIKYLDIYYEYLPEIKSHSKKLIKKYPDKSYNYIMRTIAGKKLFCLAKEFGIALDKMWKENASEFGVIYESGKL